MKQLTLTRITTVIFALTLIGFSVLAQDSENDIDAGEVVLEFVEAFNEGDYEAAAALTAEDVVMTFVPAIFQAPAISQDSVLGMFASISANEPQLETTILEVIDDEFVLAQTRTWDNEMTAMGIEALEFTEIYIVREGLIVASLSALTPESIEIMMEAMAQMEDG